MPNTSSAIKSAPTQCTPFSPLITYRPNLNLPIDHNRLILNRMQPQHRRLRQIDNRRPHQRPKHASITNRKRPPRHILNRQLIVPRLPAQPRNHLLDADELHGLGIAHHGRHQALLGGDGDADVDVVAVHDRVAAVGALDGCVDGRDVAHGEHAGARERAHEA